MNRVCGIAICVWLMFVSQAAASELSQRNSLIDVEAVEVIVSVDGDLAPLLDGRRLETVAELELRRSGISVVETSKDRSGILQIVLLGVAPVDQQVMEGYSVVGKITFNELANLQRNERRVVAATWQDLSVGYWGRHVVSDSAEKLTRALVQSFANDLMAVR